MSVNSVGLLLLAKILSNTSVTTITPNNLLRRERIPVGETHMVAAGNGVAGFDRRDSNIGYTVFEFGSTILHNLSDPSTPTSYTDLYPDQEVLMDPNFYLVAGVYEVIAPPELDPAVRIGNVIEYTVTVQLALS